MYRQRNDEELITLINNPYTGILNIMQEQGKKYNPPSICLGEISSINPLAIKTGDLELDNEDLLVSTTVSANPKQGDLVALLPTENRQTYIVLCKVVKP